MTWLRLYTSLLNDPKVQQLPPETFRGWINILCIAKDNDGYLPTTYDVAFQLRITTEEARELIDKLISCRLLDETKKGITPHNWNGRQYVSDVSTPRVKRYRERQRAVSETPPEQSRAETEQKETRADALSILKTVFSEERAKALIKHRKNKRAPLTANTAKLLVAQLSKYHDPAAGADEMMLRGWTGFKPEWMTNSNNSKPKPVSTVNGAYKTFEPEPDYQPPTPEEIARRNAAVAKIKQSVKRM